MICWSSSLQLSTSHAHLAAAQRILTDEIRTAVRIREFIVSLETGYFRPHFLGGSSSLIENEHDRTERDGTRNFDHLRDHRYSVDFNLEEIQLEFWKRKEAWICYWNEISLPSTVWRSSYFYYFYRLQEGNKLFSIPKSIFSSWKLSPREKSCFEEVARLALVSAVFFRLWSSVEFCSSVM